MVSLFVCLYHNRMRGHKVTASSVSDFKVGKYIFEVGGATWMPRRHGECYLFRCTTCRQIVPIVASHSNDRLQMPYCPNCGVGNEEPLYTWNPIEGRCPKCVGKMKEQEILHAY